MSLVEIYCGMKILGFIFTVVCVIGYLGYLFCLDFKTNRRRRARRK